MVGLKCWMGNVLNLNRGLLHRLLLLLIQKAEQQITEADLPEAELRWIVFVSYIGLTYVVALRGNEGLQLLSSAYQMMKIDRY